MSIDVAQSFRGYLASQPVQSPEGDHMRADAVIAQARTERTRSGDVVRLEPDLCHLVMRGAASLTALARIRVGDDIIATGTLISEQVFSADTGHMESRPVFEATHVGPDAASLSFEQMLHRIQPRPGILEPTRPTRPSGPTQPVGFTSAACARPDVPGL